MIRIGFIDPARLDRAIRHHADHIEQHGFVAYATCEVMHLNSGVYFASIYLAITGTLTLYTFYRGKVDD